MAKALSLKLRVRLLRAVDEGMTHRAVAHWFDVSPASVSRFRARQAGIATPFGCQTSRATCITAYVKNEGTLEKAAQNANHASTPTTQLYCRGADEMRLDDIERSLIGLMQFVKNTPRRRSKDLSPVI